MQDLSREDAERLGQVTYKAILSGMYGIALAGGVWVLLDLRGSVVRGELDDLADWAIFVFALALAIPWTLSAAWALWQVWRKEKAQA